MKRRYTLFPKTIASCTEAVTRPVFKKHGFAESRIITEWALIVGVDLASCSKPTKLTFPPQHRRDGTLHIQVHAPRALEIQYMEPQIRERIALYFGYHAVKRLIIQQCQMPPVKAVAPKPVVEATPSPCPPSILAIEDAELRQALSGLFQAWSIR